MSELAAVAKRYVDRERLRDNAIDALERMARDGRGPALSQKSVHTHAAHYGIGTTRDDFCAAIVALEKATRGKECS